LAQIIFITGGSRSGKSSHAQRLAESMAGPRTFVATCPYVDDDMAARIARHQAQRRAASWSTLEAPLGLPDALRETRDSRVRVVDCLTLWINNLLFEAQKQGRELTEDDIAGHCQAVLAACAELDGTVIFVANEVGMGIVPDNALSRQFRDLAGRCNQSIAAVSDCVILVVSGLPVNIKGAFKGDFS
jgi:adenosylcobinamide kinase/adenosylcobinamide-phosphate guanylyltransferase